MNKSLVSIIIPCYNQGRFINETLLSVYNQTYINWECIIVNDGSTDNSESIIKEWLKKDDRFKYFYKINKGVSSARNFALEKVKGTCIQFLDADDLLDKRKLELSIISLEKLKSKSNKIVISNFRMFSVNSNITTEPYCILNKEIFTYKNLLYKWNETFSIPIHCGFFETSLFDHIRFQEHLTAQEDWIVWVKLFKLKVQMIYINEPLAFYRKNPDGRTMTKSFLDDQIMAYEYFKVFLDENEFHKLSVILISRYFKIQEEYKSRLSIVKKSGIYQTGLIIKKILKTLGLLKLSRKLLPYFLKFKSNRTT